MKKKYLFFLSGTCLLAAGTLQAAIDFSDAASFYDESNWYAIRSDGTPTISKTDKSISIGSSRYDCLVFCYFNPVTLKQGESLQVSGTLSLDKIYSGTNANTVVGLFNSGAYNQTALDAALKEKSLGHAYNSKSTSFGASVVTNGMTGFLTSQKLTYNRNKPSGTSTCLSTTSGGAKTDYKESFSAPEAGKAYNFLLKILKTAEGTYSTTFSLGGGEAVTTESLSNETLKDLSVLAFRVPVATGGSVTLSDLKFETAAIPEPSAFGAFSGAAALLLCLRRRKR